jgi:folylpolyglutamate synthase/dihydropteroate synthase
MLTRCGYDISTKHVQEGLREVTAPCKFEVLSMSPTIIADSTHSNVAIGTVCDSLADFKKLTGDKVRLCLPEGELIPKFVEALEERGYLVEKVCALMSEVPENIDYPVRTTLNKTIKLTVKDALNSLSSDCILLISGPINFTKTLRYELLQTLGF